MKQADRAWLAGIIDGEGCIGIYKRKPKRGRVQYILQITMGMTCKKTMDRIVEIAGCGKVRFDPRKRYNDNSKDQWTWCIAAQNARHVLEMIRPYSVTKQEHVELGLKFQERISSFQAFSGQPIPD